MSQTKPTTLPEWDTNGTVNNEEPSAAVKADGIVFGSPSKSSYHNWFMKLVYEWLEFVNRFFATPDANTLTISDGTTVRATVNSSGVTIPNLSTTSFSATTVTGTTVQAGTLDDTGGGTVAVATDLLPTDDTFDLGGPSNRFAEVHADEAFATAVVLSGQIAPSAQLHQVNKANTPIAFCRVNCLNGLWTIDSSAPSYNIAAVDTIFYEVIDGDASDILALVGCRIELDERAAGDDYAVVVTPMRKATNATQMVQMLGTPTTAGHTASDSELPKSVSFKVATPSAAAYALSYSYASATDEPTISPGDIIVSPNVALAGSNLVKPATATFADLTAYNARGNNSFDETGAFTISGHYEFTIVVYGD